MDKSQLTAEAGNRLSEIAKNRARHEAFQEAKPDGLFSERCSVEGKAAEVHESLWKIVQGVDGWGLSQAESPLVVVRRDRSTASGPFSIIAKIVSVEAQRHTETHASVNFGVVRDGNDESDGDFIVGKTLDGRDFRGYGKWGLPETTAGIHNFDPDSRTADEVLARYARLKSMAQSLDLILEASLDERLNPHAGQAIAG